LIEKDIDLLSERTLTIIDVGHGNSAVLTCSDGVVIIDAGSKGSLLEYLLQQGIETIDTVLISHADEDHLGGLAALISSDRFHINHIQVNTDSLKSSTTWDDILYALSKMNNAGDLDFEPALTRNDEIILDDGTILVDVLGPSTYLAGKGPGGTDRHGRKLRTNSVSAVVRISVNGNPIALLPGDLDEIGLEDLLDNDVDLTSPILVFPHHGGRTGPTAAGEEFSHTLCKIASPSVVIFSTGRRRVRNPRPEIIQAVRGASPDVRIFCTQLSEHCAAATPQNNPPHLNEVFCKGRECKECCAGSIIIDLNNPDNILPLYGDLQAFISTEAPTALCQRSAEAASNTNG